MSEDKKDFVVKDRRAFSQDKESPEESEVKEEHPHQNEAEEEADSSIEDNNEDNEDYPLPEINFPTFIFSLSSSVYVQLGFIEEPGTGKKAKNLPLAKQTIDILGMLEEKTRGNLTKEEENMLKNILYDLRMLYIREKE